ncbi:MAG: ABC transporter ATP-binding protein [Desulfurococcaceae archaeon]
MINVKSLTVKYGDFTALNDITLSIPENKATCILGPNGAGKSTLLKTIAKLVDYRGCLYLDGLEVSKTPIKTIARLVSYVQPIDTREFMGLTVRDVLLIAQYPVTTGFIESSFHLERAITVLKQLGSDKLIHRKLNELSSGELQRVVLAIGLVKNPKYLLFDEIDLHIDIGFKKSLVKLIRVWSRDKTVVFTTHDLVFGTSIGDYFILLDQGRVVYIGESEDLINNVELVEKVFNAKIITYRYGERYILIPIYY